MQPENDVGRTYAEIFNSSAEGIIIVNRNGEIIMANPQSEKLFDYERGEFINKKIECLIPHQYRKRHVGHRNSYHENPRPMQMGKGRDLVGLAKNGREFPIEVSLNPAKINNEQVVIAFVIDITERKKIERALEESEKQLVKYAAELEKRVSDRTEELATTIKKLEDTNERLECEIIERKKAEEEARKSLEKEKELNELKSRFVSMASHEFRTPLSTILSSATLISRYNTPETADKKLKHIDRIKSNVQDLTGILNDFLSLDKLEEGRIQANEQQFDLVLLVREIAEQLQSVAKKGQSISFATPHHECVINTDPQLLKQIVSNLVSNAIKYSPEGKTIVVSVQQENGEANVTVKDSGIGIPENDQKHLFERFFRAHNVTNIQGTGLGLNLVKKYLDLMGGTITYKSIEHEGSTFKISLPYS